MDPATASALRAINRRFYEERAQEFSDSRNAPWPGWLRVAPHLREFTEGGRPLSLLDAGCGNGRFAHFLAEQLPGRVIDYTGVDASAALLEIAGGRVLPGLSARWLHLDFVESGTTLPTGPFDCVTLFGVLHEVPGRTRRQALIAQLAERLRADGLLALARWRVAELPRLRERFLPWSAFGEHCALPLDPAQLEAGDHLLPWGEGRFVRYVHAIEREELSEATRDLPLAPLDEFMEDGRERQLNHYAIFRRL